MLWEADIASALELWFSFPMLRGSIFIMSAIGLWGCGQSGAPVGPECLSPLSGWSTPEDGPSPFRVKNVIGFLPSGVTLNGQPVGEERLLASLKAAKAMETPWFTVLDPTGAPDCRTAIKLRDQIDKVVDCRGDGVCGQGSIKEWRKADGLSGQD